MVWFANQVPFIFRIFFFCLYGATRDWVVECNKDTAQLGSEGLQEMSVLLLCYCKLCTFLSIYNIAGEAPWHAFYDWNGMEDYYYTPFARRDSELVVGSRSLSTIEHYPDWVKCIRPSKISRLLCFSKTFLFVNK